MLVQLDSYTYTTRNARCTCTCFLAIPRVSILDIHKVRSLWLYSVKPRCYHIMLYSITIVNMQCKFLTWHSKRYCTSNVDFSITGCHQLHSEWYLQLGCTRGVGHSPEISSNPNLKFDEINFLDISVNFRAL